MNAQSSTGRVRIGPGDNTDVKDTLEKLWVVCVLVLSTTAFVNLLPGEGGVEFEEQGKLVAQVVWTLLYLVMLLLLRKNAAEFLRLIWQNKPLVALLAWACLSVAWSINRQVTVRHFAAVLLSSGFGVYLAFRYGLREQLRLVSVALWIVIVASIIACLFFPSYGINAEESTTGLAWQGVLTDKNGLARLALLQALILALYFVKRIRRPIAVVGIILLFFIVILTQSKTALVYFTLGVLGFPFVRTFQMNPRKRRAIAVSAMFLFGALAMWVYENWETFTYSLGKDPELTGRVALWGLSINWIQERPLLGYGYEGFWSSYYGPAADFRIASGWMATHAHNGFINLWLDLGLMGVVLFLIGFTITYWQAVKFTQISRNVEGIWPVIFLTVYLAFSFTEVNFISRNELLWILFVSLMTGLRSNFCQIPRKQVASGCS